MKQTWQTFCDVCDEEIVEARVCFHDFVVHPHCEAKLYERLRAAYKPTDDTPDCA